MSHFLEFDLAAGGTVLVEVAAPPPTDGMERTGAAAAVIRKAAGTFEAAVAGIAPVARAVLDGLVKVPTSATEISVELAFKLSATGGLIVANAGGEASIKATLKWQPPKAGAP